ncbi:MAG TPA: hypothetical protein VFP58_14115 [Candidatus Eisenbacteria bacterium]|nr:hypothetical protein [Candidatus Eisenbacteria bacterium]
MTLDPTDQKSISNRLEKLERENRRLKVYGSVVLLGVAGALCMGLAAAPSKKLEAEVIVLKGSHGKAQMILGVGEEGPALTLVDREGKLRVNIDASADGPGIDLLDAKESPRAQLMVTEDQGPLLNFTDSKGAQVSLKP